MQVVRPVNVITGGIPLIEIYATQIYDPEKGRQVLYYREVDYVAGRMADGADLDPTRPRLWRSLHKKELARGSVWITFHYHGSVPQMWEQDRGYTRVVSKQITLGYEGLIPEDLLQIGEPYTALAEHQFDFIVARNHDRPDR